MILHTINKPAALADCLDVIQGEDTVVLLEDGVYAASDALLATGAEVKAVAADVAARGYATRLPSEVERIDYRRFVQLTAAAEHNCNWY